MEDTLSLREVFKLQQEMALLKRLHQINVAANFHVRAIMEIDDIEMIKLHIEALQYIEDNNFNNGFDIKEKIREGYESFVLIQNKCIALGVV